MTRIHVAANRGDIGGGEVMLLRLAAALAELGYDVTVVVPSTPSDLAVQARAAGLTVEEVPCHDRPSYARALRRWDRGREGVLWCNGLLPALATAGRPTPDRAPAPDAARARGRPLARVARRRRWRPSCRPATSPSASPRPRCCPTGPMRGQEEPAAT